MRFGDGPHRRCRYDHVADAVVAKKEQPVRTRGPVRPGDRRLAHHLRQSPDPDPSPAQFKALEHAKKVMIVLRAGTDAPVPVRAEWRFLLAHDYSRAGESSPHDRPALRSEHNLRSS